MTKWQHSSRHVSLKGRMRVLRIHKDVLCHKKDNKSDVTTISTSKMLLTSGTCRRQQFLGVKENVTDKDSNVSVSFASTSSDVSVNTCDQIDRIVSNNLSSVLEKCNNTNLRNMHVFADETDVTNDDTMTLQSVSETFSENACTVEDVEIGNARRYS